MQTTSALAVLAVVILKARIHTANSKERWIMDSNVPVVLFFLAFVASAMQLIFEPSMEALITLMSTAAALYILIQEN